MRKGKRYMGLFLAIILVVTILPSEALRAAENNGMRELAGVMEETETTEDENTVLPEETGRIEEITETENTALPEETESAQEIAETENTVLPEETESTEEMIETKSAEMKSTEVSEGSDEAEEEWELQEQEENKFGEFSQDGVYRAVFDGTSTRKNIQKVLNMVRDGTTEKLEVTLTGNIELDGGLVVYSNTTIHAEGAVIKSTSSGASLITSATAKDYGAVIYEAGYQKTQNITIMGGTWDGGRLSAQVVRFVHSSNVVLDGLTVMNCTDKGHLITLEGVNQALVQNCTVIGHSDMGLYKEAIHLDIVHNSVTSPHLMSEEYDDLPDRNITIINNIIKDASNGIGSHAAVRGVYHQNIVIANNDFSNISEMALPIFNYKNTTITGNTIHDSNNGIKIYTYYNVDNIDCREPLANTVLEGEPAACNYQITIEGNTFSNIFTGPSIWIQGNENRKLGGIRIANNTLTGAMKGNGMYVEYLTDGVISGNVFLPQKGNAPDFGIYASYAKNMEISGNTINDMAVGGIKIENQSHGTQLKKNTIANCKKVGIYSLYSKVSIEENKISDISGDALCIWNAGKNMIISKNKLTNIKGIGIGLNATKKAQITGNTLENVKGNAINLNVATANEKTRRMPVVKKVTVKKGIVTGNVVKGSKYKVKVNGKKYKLIIKKGKFKTAAIKNLKKNDTVTITETTSAKNKLIKKMTVK